MDPIIPKSTYGTSVWRGIKNMWSSFNSQTAFSVTTGNSVRFWQDTWIGGQPLRSRFPTIFRLTKNPEAWVSEVMSVDGDYTSWDLDL
ncbi:hypothetical protein BVC80_6297g1 [Macleaya cordata]|uniref:Reverse transcriptase zinc-binding domain n=1 Tax=Macleaya cordata TaxID=56857 RepID=A0A200Q0Q6_MACCD|nr:hypothetical protein BVC80_6297g1 [Macleaya cordata]